MAKRELYTAPSGNVVNIATLAAHLRIDARDEDDVLSDLLSDAVAAVQDYTRRVLLTQTWDQYYDDFADPLILAVQPVESVTLITYTDSNGSSQTLATSVYELGSEDGAPVVRRKHNEDWPVTRDHKDVVKVRYVAGYGDPADVPESLAKAVRVHAAWNHRHREGEALPDGFYHLLAPYKVRYT